MRIPSRPTLPLMSIGLIAVLAACSQDTPTAPAADAGAGPAFARTASSSALPSGERIVGRTAIEPAYNADTGEIIDLITPEKSPFPTKANAHAVSPLYLVEYPPG